MSDPYTTLGISAQSSEAEIEQAYRRARRAAHPDTGGSPEAFAAVQHAYAALKKRPCPDCEGSGFVKVRSGIFTTKNPCPKCWNRK